MHKVTIKVVAHALDANATIAAANRADFDRAGVKVINRMSAPGAGKTSLLERVLRLDGVATGVLEGDGQGASTPTVSPIGTCRFRSRSLTRASAASAILMRTWSARRCPRWRCQGSTWW